jgi:hypothetical protein
MRALRIGGDKAVLAVIVLAAFVLRLLAGLGRPTIMILPDEYFYAELSRSLALHGHAWIRGEPAHFPALLFPLLIMPFAAIGDPHVAYKLIQGFNALVGSLAAIPAYLLGRELGFSRFTRLGLAAFAVAVPDLLYASYISADVLAYTLSLTAVLLGLRALDRPGRLRIALFLLSAGAATFARTEYVALFPAFALAWLVLDRRRALQAFRGPAVIVATCCGLVAVAFAATRMRSVLGFYKGVLDYGLHPLAIARWVAIDSLVLLYSAGAAIVPGALIGLGAGLFAPRDRREHAFSLLAALLAVVLFLEAALYATNGSDRVQERYLFALLPLVAVFFALAAGRSRRLAIAGVAVAGVSAILLLQFPLTAYSVNGRIFDSPLLMGFRWLEGRTDSGQASLIATTIALGLLALGAFALFGSRVTAALALSAAVVATTTASLGATTFINAESRKGARTYLPKPFDRVDQLASAPVGVLLTRESPRTAGSELMFWNRSITDPINLPGSPIVDIFGHRKARIAPDGRLLVDGRLWHSPLVVSNYASKLELRSARRLLHTVSLDLWRPEGEARVAFLTEGLFLDGFIFQSSHTRVWPDESGRLRGTIRFRLTLPSAYPATRVVFDTPWGRRSVALAPGSTRVMSIPLSGTGPARIDTLFVHGVRLPDGRVVGARASVEMS